MEKERTPIRRLLFLGYGIWMLWLLFGQRMGEIPGGEYWQQLLQRLNLTPFATIKRFWHVLEHFEDPNMLRQAVVNLVGNVVMFVPLGFFLPFIWRRMQRLWRTFLCSAAVILAVELLQLFTLLGSCDIDDLILNLLGILMGYILWKLVKLLGKKP